MTLEEVLKEITKVNREIAVVKAAHISDELKKRLGAACLAKLVALEESLVQPVDKKGAK